MSAAAARSDAWRPLLTDGEAEHVRALVREDAQLCIAAVLTGPPMFDLADGAVGASILLGELERSGLAQGLPAAAVVLGATTSQANSARAPAGLWQGLAGLAWARAHLGGHSLSESSQRTLQRWLSRQDNVDLIGGVVGVGALGLELGSDGQTLVAAAVDRLGSLAVGDEDGLTWPRPSASAGREHDLGIAHGHAGVVGFLAGAARAHVPARDLLSSGSRWLLAQAPPRPSRAAFPHFRGATASRLAWCYGDPGVAVALIRAGGALESEELLAAGSDVARRAASRLDDESVVDAGLCHGSAGLLQVFMRLWQYTGDADCAHAARFWLERTLRYRRGGNDTLPYVSAQAQGSALRFADDAGLLTGGAGACLALLAATETRDPAWDRAMLLSG